MDSKNYDLANLDNIPVEVEMVSANTQYANPDNAIANLGMAHQLARLGQNSSVVPEIT